MATLVLGVAIVGLGAITIVNRCWRVMSASKARKCC